MTFGLDKGYYYSFIKSSFFSKSYIVGIEKFNDFYYVYMYVCLYKHTVKSFVG